MNKKLIRLTESDLHKIVKESVKKALNEIDYSNFDFSKTRGFNLPTGDGAWYSPKEIKEKILNLQNALKEVMNITNGDGVGRELSRELFKECYSFYNYISKFCIELNKDVTNFEGSWEEDHSDIPFIRTYDDEYGIQNYFGKDGNPVDEKGFRTNFKPHK